MKILIKNGYIVDGTGNKGYYGSILTDGRKIEKVSGDIECSADRVLDATGRIVCPGFIDTHSHSDVQLLVNPSIEAKIRQGITTEILGQDGISVAPLPKHHIADWRKNLAGLDGDDESIDWDFSTSADYLNRLEQNGIGLNAGYLAPHGNIRMEAMGLDNRRPSAAEIEKMKEIMQREMENGVLGLSSGLIYPPCAYGDDSELIALCKIVAKYDGVFVVHQRSEADDILNSMDEIINIARESGVRIHFSHFKVCGKKNWDKIDSVLKKLDSAEAEGIHISYDQYPYVSGSTMLAVILPPWAHAGGTGNMLERIKDSEVRKRIKTEIKSGIEGWDNFVDFAGFDQIYITSVRTEINRWCIGKSLEEISAAEGKDPVDAALDLLIEEENAVGMIDFYGLEEHIRIFMKRPEQNVCTDGLLGGKPHPRVYGAFPRVLAKYVRDEGFMPIEEAIYKMTLKAANVFRLSDRGCLKAGKAADIVIFDPATVKDRSTYIEPDQYPDGIETVIINGKIAVINSNYVKEIPGEVIRKI
jgi:N-acyl-D-amino-acid deacylase